MPLSSPFTAIGRLEAEVRSLELSINRKADDWKIAEIQNSIGQLKISVENLQSKIDSVVSCIEDLKQMREV